jgi:hypothetical protein
MPDTVDMSHRWQMVAVTESLNVNTDDRALLPLPEPVRLAVQVEEPT